MALPEGWYPVSGDPAGTQRYWDGEAFTTGPKRDGSALRKSGFIKPNSASKWRLATPIARLIAAIVDLGSPIAIVLGMANGMGEPVPELTISGVTDSPQLFLIIAACILVNQVVLVGIWGVSLGRILLGLRVVDYRDQDRSPGLLRAFVRLSLAGPGMALTAMMFALGKRRGIHDLAAGTAVIYA